ncbi:MAG: hypothetical protein R3F53_29355 [Gammaproteobacteria bacterium]
MLSLPLLNTHVALAGYADLWLTACYGLAALSLLQWCRSGDYRQLGLGLLLGVCLPLIKVDGTVWALGLLVLVLVRALGKGFWILLLLTLVGATVWYRLGGVQLGPWQITPQLIELPYIGRYELFYTANWAAVRDPVTVWRQLAFALASRPAESAGAAVSRFAAALASLVLRRGIIPVRSAGAVCAVLLHPGGAMGC